MYTPQTDLYTHFAGVLPAHRLIELALAHDLKLDIQTAKSLGFTNKDSHDDPLPVRSLLPQQLRQLESALSLENVDQVSA